MRIHLCLNGFGRMQLGYVWRTVKGSATSTAGYDSGRFNHSYILHLPLARRTYPWKLKF